MATSTNSPPKADLPEGPRIHYPKKLIVCCDGTWQDSDNGWKPGSGGKPGTMQNPSNVTRISRAIKSEDAGHHPQIVYYQAGIGTGIGLYDHLVGGGTGMGLSENIREAYAFLAANYAPHDHIKPDPDSIFLLGFSRGAFTARSLGGFITAVGILTKKALPFFYECFLDWEKAGDATHKPLFIDAYLKAYPEEEKQIRADQPDIALSHVRGGKNIDKYMSAYRNHLSNHGLTQKDVKIQAIGCWDTVGALGIPINPVLQKVTGLPTFIKDYRWFDTRLDEKVEHAFQALALDEHRAPFSPALWELNNGHSEAERNKVTQLKQVWFPGAHGNVGGSYDDTGTANMTLAWMMDHLAGNHIPRESFKHSKWIEFDDDYIDDAFRQNQTYFKANPDMKPYDGWGMGKLFNTCIFPQSLAGERVRTPGKYHQTDYDTGNYTSELLHETNEFVHSSIRARIDRAGRGVEPSAKYQEVFSSIWRFVTRQKKPPVYNPTRQATATAGPGPLLGWKLHDGHAADPEVVDWRYTGKDVRPDSITVLPEDVPAPNGYELKLLAHDKVASDIVFTKAQWSLLHKPELKKNGAQTF